MALLDVQDLTVAFRTTVGLVHAVKGVSFSVERGATLGIVGESGSGKSVTVKSLMGLLPATADISGSATYDGLDLFNLDKQRRKHFFGVDIAMVFQNPMTSLNPVKRIGDQLTEGMRFHRKLSQSAATSRALELLDLVRITEPKQRLGQYPHELSGGMRQRVVIAMALANNPALLIADEPTTALDVTVQREILDLLDTLCDDLDMAMVMITHDLGVVKDRADDVVVMYRGNVVETAPTNKLFSAPAHRYTEALLGSVLDVSMPKGTRLTPIPDLDAHGNPI